MSALDQAFTKAYSNKAAASAPAATRQALVRMRTAGPAPLADSAAPAAQLDHLYADGALYRVEAPQAAEVPPPHYTPPASQQRTVQRRVAGRHRGAASPAIDTVPPVSEPPAPPRRMPALGLNEIARRLAYYIPPAPAADLPPEVLVVEEPAVSSPLPLPTVNETPQAATMVAAPVPPPQDPPASPPATQPHEIPPLDDVATLVEVCTPWESINDAVSGSLVILTDPPAMPAKAQALFETALDPIEARGRAVADEPVPVESVAAEVSAEKNYRVDPPQPQAVQPPHIASVRDAGSEPPAALPLASLTPAETESLLGSPPEVSAAEAPASVAVVAAALNEPLVPMWEVDRLQWPSICDRLMKDEQSYFAQAGGKLVAAAKDGLKTLGITGSRRGEGRTTLALCLARCAAQSGLNVAMIDADFTRPQLAAVIGLEVAYGWQDAAQGKIPLPEATVRSLADKITVLPLEPSSVAWPLALADKRVASLIRSVAQSHDLVIVDLGPTSGGSEPLFAVDETPPLDAVIVLRDLRYATPSETQAVGQRLHDSGIEAVGIAENFVPAEKTRA
ncbi:MAG TPA: P-loop NTPase [Pirellulaceae bacterium]|nr:P-loop NTPase [Pirellulaceae bacterium]